MEAVVAGALVDRETLAKEVEVALVDGLVVGELVGGVDGVEAVDKMEPVNEAEFVNKAELVVVALPSNSLPCPAVTV